MGCCSPGLWCSYGARWMQVVGMKGLLVALMAVGGLKMGSAQDIGAMAPEANRLIDVRRHCPRAGPAVTRLFWPLLTRRTDLLSRFGSACGVCRVWSACLPVCRIERGPPSGRTRRLHVPCPATSGVRRCQSLRTATLCAARMPCAGVTLDAFGWTGCVLGGLDRC